MTSWPAPTCWRRSSCAFGTLPPKLLIVGAGDPMWRGGLSGPNSLYLHANRPLISENGTSTLAHELVHVITRIGGRGDEVTTLLAPRSSGARTARAVTLFAELDRELRVLTHSSL